MSSMKDQTMVTNCSGVKFLANTPVPNPASNSINPRQDFEPPVFIKSDLVANQPASSVMRISRADKSLRPVEKAPRTASLPLQIKIGIAASPVRARWQSIGCIRRASNDCLKMSSMDVRVENIKGPPSLSMASGDGETTDPPATVADLVKRRYEIEENLRNLQVNLLESLWEEYLITDVLPGGFEELKSQVIADNPTLKTTSYPLGHLLTKIHSEPAFKLPLSEKQQWSTSMSTSCETVDSSKKSSNDTVVSFDYANYRYYDSLNTSFSSAMDEMSRSVHWPECKNDSLSNISYFSEFKPTDTRDLINAKLRALDQDYAIASHLYRVHKQRATETNRLAFRSAYKCNAQKMKQIDREKATLKEQLRCLNASGQSSVASISKFPNETFSYAHSQEKHTPVIAPTPRRKTMLFPSFSATNTLRLRGWKRRQTLKQIDSENSTAPGIRQEVDECEYSRSKAPLIGETQGRVALLPMAFNLHKCQVEAESTGRAKLDTGLAVAQLVVGAVQMPYSSLEMVNPRHSMISPVGFRETQIARSTSSPTLCQVASVESRHKYTLECKLEDVERSLNHRTMGDESSDKSGALKSRTSSRRMSQTKTAYPGAASHRSSSGCYSFTSQSSSILAPPSPQTSEVCLRRASISSPIASPIRCICSCISEDLSSGLVCSFCDEVGEEGNKKNKKEFSGTKSDEIHLTPLPHHRANPETIQKKTIRRSLNPLAFFLPTDNRRLRASIWPRERLPVIQVQK